jgi:hypothetical protein
MVLGGGKKKTCRAMTAPYWLLTPTAYQASLLGQFVHGRRVRVGQPPVPLSGRSRFAHKTGERIEPRHNRLEKRFVDIPVMIDTLIVVEIA